MSTQIEMDFAGLIPIADKRKLLNQFIIKTEENQVNSVVESAKNLPSSQFNLLKFLLADKFHRFDLIIELLYNGEPFIISAATSKRWLYETPDSIFTDCDFLINKLFPNVSYNCRQKVLYRLGRHMQSEEKADRIWCAVEARYGFHVALPLLQACTKDKINSTIASRKVDLSGYQLLQILETHYDIGMQYLKNRFADTGSIGTATASYKSALVYLYENHTDDFVELCVTHSGIASSFKFGRCRSTKIIRAYREKLLAKPEKTSSLLKIDRIRREFSAEEFQTFFESSFGDTTPTNVNMTEMWKWVNTVPIYQRVDMVNRAFTKLFQLNLDEHPVMVDPQYIVLLPVEKRLSVIEWKSVNDQNYGWTFRELHSYYYSDDDKKRAWLSLKPISHSVPELQNLLLIEPDAAKRATLSKFLLETCYINDDLPQLLKVLLLLSKRCRNDQSDVRVNIFLTLSVIMNHMEFTKEHWDIIVEMIQVSLVFSDSHDYSDSNKEKLLEKCIAYHITSKQPVNNLVATYIKLKIKTGTNTWTNDSIKNDADRRSLLVLYAKEVENLQLTNDLRSHEGTVLEAEKLAEFIANLIEEICKFNKRVAKVPSLKLEPISFASNQWLRTSLETIAKEEEDRINKNSNLYSSRHSWNFAEQLVNIIQALRKEEHLSLDAFSDSESLFSKILTISPCSSIVTYFLAKNPSKLVENWPKTLSKMLKIESGLTLMRTLQSWNYPALTVPAIKTCLELIEQPLDHDSEVTIQQKCNAVAVLSVLSKSTDFLSFAEKFYPTESKVDVFADNSKEDYKIRETIAKSLVNVSDSHLAFPALEIFCAGDYLKLAVGALYSHTGRAAEAKTLNFLHRKLTKSPVSLLKHIIRIYYVIGTVEQRLAAFKEVSSDNVSIRYEMFCRANKLLRTSTSQEAWTLLKNIMEKTTADDAAVIKHLDSKPKLDTFPIEFISEFTIASLTLLRKLKPENVNNFMGHIESIMAKIPEETLDEVILHSSGEQTAFSHSFCVKYIQNSSTESAAEHRLSTMCRLLENAVRNGWETKTPRPYDSSNFDYPIRDSVFGFVSTLCQSPVDDASKVWLNRKIFQTLLEKFKTENVTKVFRVILYLELGLLLENEAEKRGMEHLQAFGRSVARFTDSLVEKYGAEIVLIVKEVLSEYVGSRFSDEFNKNVGAIVELVDGILETSTTRSNQIISIYLLRNANPVSGKLVATLEKINNVLKESNDVVVQMYRGWVTK